jgi:hypothetical protein
MRYYTRIQQEEARISTFLVSHRQCISRTSLSIDLLALIVHLSRDGMQYW